MKIDPFNIVEFRPATDCHIATAIIGGVASVGSSLIGASAAKSAADQQADAQNNAIAEQRQMFDITKGELQPYIDAGTGIMPALQGWIDPTKASSPLASLLKLTTPGANMNDVLAKTPGFQFTQQYGLKGINNALAARGLAGPGGALARAGADYSAGLASNTWQSVVNSLLGTYQAGATPLQNLVNTGASAAGALAGNATTVGGNIGQNMVGIGNAQAAGTLGAAGAIGGGINSLGQYGMLANLVRGSGGGNGIYGFASGAPYLGTPGGAAAPWVNPDTGAVGLGG